MNKIFLFSTLGFVSILLFSCSKSNLESNANAPVDIDNSFLEVQTVTQKNHPHIQIIETKAKDTIYKGNDGILISIITIIQPNVFASLEKPYQAIWVDLMYGGDSLFSCRKFEYPLFEQTTFYPATPNLLQKADTVEIHFHLPYRKLGNNTSNRVPFDIGFFPLSFTSDPNRTESKICAPPSDQAIALFTSTVKVDVPKLQPLQLSLQNIILNPAGKKTTSYDVALGGKGLPDIYWQLWCGSELVFYSPTKKNSEVYEERVSTPPFTISERDLVEIKILDYDNGPFNQDDIICSWKGSYHELRKLRVLQDAKLTGANVIIQ
jgi:hypothetical protein